MRNRIFYRVSSIAVFTALTVLALLQYRWVTSSTEKAITELEKNFNISVYGTIAREFNNFDILRQKPQYKSEDSSKQTMRENIEDIYFDIIDTYDEKYINSFSYFKEESTNEIYSYENGIWKEEKRYIGIIEKMFQDSRPPEFQNIFMFPDENQKNETWFMKPVKFDERVLILVSFNIQDFFNDIILPEVQSVWSEYQLDYSFTIPEHGIVLNENRYRFSPLKNILNNLFLNKYTEKLYLPFYLTPFERFDKENLKTKQNKPFIYVNIRKDDISVFREKENEMTIQWAMSLLLLLGLGSAYALILYQISSLRQLRKREKEFVATVTHELRTPLTVIRAAADNIKSGIISSERAKQYGHLIIDQSTRLSSMIEGILLFSRLEGKAELAPPINIINFPEIKKNLEIVIKTLKDEYNKKIILDFGSLPETAFSDRETIELILTNLITNSCKHAYNREKSGEVRINGHVQLPNTLIFSVEDDGFGIDKSEKKHIFDPFFRGNASFQNQIKGSGLGLYLSHRKARLLGGSLTVDSPYEKPAGQMRKGSCFILKIPYYQQNEVQKK